MNQISILVFFASLFLLLHSVRPQVDQDDVRNALVKYLGKLSNGNGIPDPTQGWNLTSYPCKDNWVGVKCDAHFTVKRINLDHFKFSGIFDPSTLCSVQSLAASLTIISLNENTLRGENIDELANCNQITGFHIGGNQFSGSLPEAFARLNNLKRLDISRNSFSGVLPDLARISGLTEFSAQENQLSGPIPKFDFPNFNTFNVSVNKFSGPIPRGGDLFNVSCYSDNPDLCGAPLTNRCKSLPYNSSGDDTSRKGLSNDQILMYSGYFLVGLVVVLLIIFRVCKNKKAKEERYDTVNKVVAINDDSSINASFVSSEYKSVVNKSGVSVASAESGPVSASLVVLTSPEVNGLKFEELLKAPAELLGRGKHGSVYKVICQDQGMTLAVKRIKDWGISSSDFKQRMQRLDQVKHPNVLPAVAFYCSKQEKLLVYEYQPNGSVFKLLHGTQLNQVFDWGSRLGVAATTAEALAFMHEELHEDGIAHGNLKSSNILLNKNLEPYISEYGLMATENQDLSLVSSVNSYQATGASDGTFKGDIYGFGVILLEMLTGKISTVQNNGMDLATWVVSVVREEWTVEVFDRTLVREGASEERMVGLLQIAIKCVNRSAEARPSINQVALMINTIREEEERSMDTSGPL
ncbi:hypothetical protein RJ640_024357 [Escallonia rubra]|uniref:Protein kinase domain-containing protein n=1 Tax=Escallonia rubra TaxID=112253 RepID=A0AA88UUJ9_9ASTE|nr:hypothetical protein RJ640_024357 [Escallonia rubra]